MSGTVSGITKVFSSIGAGVGAAAATLGSAVKAVGSSLFTAGAASGSGIASGGGFFSNLLGSNSTLGSMFSGVSNILGLGGGGAAATTSATGLTGLGTNVVDKAGNFFDSTLGEAALGAAQGWAAGEAQKDQIEAVRELQNDRFKAERLANERVTKSYNVANSALVGGSLEASTPQAVTQATTPRPTRKPSEMWAYDPKLGIRRVPRTAVA